MFLKAVLCFVACFALIDNAVIEHKNFASLQAALDDAQKYIIKFNETRNFPSLVFGVSHKGKTVIEKAWGLADLENQVAAKLTTKYRIASISKTFTAAIIGQFLEKGLIHSFDDPITKYLGEDIFPAKKWQDHPVNVTIRHLLSHTGGVYVAKDVDEVTRADPAQNVTHMLHRYTKRPLEFQPGSSFNYANYGFQLLGGIIEKLTKKTFQQVALEFLHQNGLNHSTVSNMSLVIPEIARFYRPLSIDNMKANAPSLVIDTMLMLNGYWPAGGIISTVGDLLKYGQLMIDSYHGRKNAILSTKTVKEMWTPQTPPNTVAMKFIGDHYQISSEYGLGWIVANKNAKLNHPKMFWHAGGMQGVATMLVVYPQEEVVGVAMTNKGGGQDLAPMIMYTVENIYNLIK